MGSEIRFDDLGGEVSLRERSAEKSERDIWESRELVTYDWDKMNLEVEIHREDDDGNSIEPSLQLGISCYHVKNEETGRAFHCNLNARLDRRQAQQLRAYLNYLIDHEW